MRGVMSAAVMVAMLSAAAPASAQYRGWDRPPPRHRHDGGNGIGGFLLGALVAGGLVAAISSASRAAPRTQGADAYPPPNPPGDASPSQADEDAAVSACAAAAESEARRDYRIAQVDRIIAVDPDGPGFAVKGELLTRADYREAGERRLFRCSVDGEAVRRVAIDPLPGPDLATR